MHAALYPVPVSAAGVSRVVPQAPLATRPVVIVHLPMWPSTRLAGVLGRRFVLGSAAARVCREAGGRVTVNVRVQEMDFLPFRQVDHRRLEVVVDGLPLFRGAQLATDTTMVSPIRRDGTTRRQCASTNGAALLQARRRKEMTYPELVGDMGGPDWWCSVARSGEGGPLRPAVS